MAQVGLTEQLSVVLEEILRTPEFEGVYVGPWWEVAATSEAAGTTEEPAWKCAVLLRRPGGGAEHWGHLFLVAGSRASRAIVAPVQLAGLPDSRFGAPVVFGSVGVEPPFALIARPTNVGTDPPIVTLARQVVERFCRDLSHSGASDPHPPSSTES